MSDIYDRNLWPEPERNPLVQMLLSDEQWFSNEDLVRALGLAPKRGLVSNQTTFVHHLREGDTAIESRNWMTPTKRITRSHGGTTRLFNRRALVIAGMRTNTVNAAAFRDWLASRAAGA